LVRVSSEQIAGLLSPGSGTSLVAPGLFDSSLISESPSVGDHQVEVGIIVNGGRDVVVILNEFFFGNNMVWSIIVSHGVSSLEGFKELLKDLLLSLLTHLNSWVVLGIVDSSDIVDVNVSILVLIQSVIGLQNDLLSLGSHWTSDSGDEFIELDGTTVIKIKVVEEFADFLIIETEHVVIHGFGELLLVERVRSIVIHNFELSLKTNESLGTS